MKYLTAVAAVVVGLALPSSAHAQSGSSITVVSASGSQITATFSASFNHCTSAGTAGGSPMPLRFQSGRRVRPIPRTLRSSTSGPSRRTSSEANTETFTRRTAPRLISASTCISRRWRTCWWRSPRTRPAHRIRTDAHADACACAREARPDDRERGASARGRRAQGQVPSELDQQLAKRRRDRRHIGLGRLAHPALRFRGRLHQAAWILAPAGSSSTLRSQASRCRWPCGRSPPSALSP